MKIAQIAPLYEAVPPKQYGGTERIIAYLCDALSDAGEDVTLFAAAGSDTKAHLIPARRHEIHLDRSVASSADFAAHLRMLFDLRRRAAQFDILHFHTNLIHLALFEREARKTVTTLHGRLDSPDLNPVYEECNDFGLVSISNSQRAPLAHAHWLATVPHGIPSHQYEFHERSNAGYLAFLGRLSPEKRPDVAIRLALRANVPLKISARLNAPDTPYFESVVKPLLTDPGVEFVGEIGEAQKPHFLGNARALLFPIDWPEPFGLVMIEAMACGTPVVAWRRGAVPEVVDEGVTGFVVDSEEEAVAAIARVSDLDRRRIRATFLRRFSAAAMAAGYQAVYSRLLSSR